MHIYHLALGGCLTAPHVRYGVTEDTGGHISYVLGAATAQAARADVASVTIVTRAFDDPDLGADHKQIWQPVQPKLAIRRLQTSNGSYLAKEALAAELPALQAAFLALLADPALRPDVIHAHFADAAILAAAAQEAYGIPFIYTPHSLGIDKLTHLNAAAGPLLLARIAKEKAALTAADAIVVSSRDEAERQVSGYGLEIDGKVHRVWPGVDLLRAASIDRGPAHDLLAGHLDQRDRPIILAIARPVRRKNLELLAQTYVDSPALQAQANLVILAGQHGSDVIESDETAAVWASLNRILSHPSLEGHVALPAAHNPRDVATLYAFARQTRGVFVNLALHEPFGLTLLEAASQGLPVIAGNRGGPPDILARTGHGRVIDPTQPVVVEAALLELLRDPVAWDAHSQAAEENLWPFDWNIWAATVTGVYASLIAPPVVGSRPAYIFGSDIDHTLTGSAPAAAAFNAWHSKRRGLFVVATGRSIIEARRVLTDWNLPVPDVFITAVGTEIHETDARGHWTLDREYAAMLDRDWQHGKVRSCISDAGISWQANEEQRRWKFGCYGTEADADRLRLRLRQAGLAARVIVSHGQLIDVLPVNGGKGKALTFLARRFGLTAQDVIAAGDSGNDVDMLMACGRGIVVGNALPEIGHLRAEKHVYHARAAHAAGVLEGLAAFGLLDQPRATNLFGSSSQPVRVAS
ncbi:HAD-IIB family hydrolase [Loktanella sp. M215]|uniref:HAD-IIB family hydrolase n=1 Tax=Loktanella sp. M215 TaxID=2675431 RepID=UPI001F01F5B6|nr:HAD-IIB family hydrolase [Loktanella sp. M215]MCF7701757.1 HAD-IIB family hydrolase [Loktanella sp. M215]